LSVRVGPEFLRAVALDKDLIGARRRVAGRKTEDAIELERINNKIRDHREHRENKGRSRRCP
jgi:hypothetical protein